MDVGLFMPLMIAAVQSAGNVLSSFVSKAKDVANKHIFDKEFLEKAITDSTDQLSDLLKVVSTDIKQEIIEQGIIDVVQDLQAHIISMGRLINSVQKSEISPEVADKLIASGIYPLSVSIQRAELRLKFHGRHDMLSHCHIVGTNALLAGYRYLGQNAPSYQKDLEDSVYKFQKRLLDSIAYMTIHAKKEIPWEQVPHLMTIEGISDLVELYNSMLETSTVTPSKKPASDKSGTYIPKLENKEINNLLELFQSPMAYIRETALNDITRMNITDPRIIGAIEILATSDSVDIIRNHAQRTLNALRKNANL